MSTTLEAEPPPVESSAPHSSWFRQDSGVAKIAERIAHIVGGVCVLGLLLRLTFRDHIPRIAVVYYMTPLIVQSVSYFGIAAVFWWRRKIPWAELSVCLAVLCAGWWGSSCLFLKANPNEPSQVSVLLWNTQRGVHAWPKIAEFLRDHDAPIIGLVEAATITAERPEFWINEFTDRNVVTFPHQLAVITKAEVLSREHGELHPGSFYGRVDLRWKQQVLTVFVVDIKSKAWGTHREAALKSLEELVGKVTENPAIVMGDFNTPTDSVFFDSWRTTMRNSFEESGQGHAATWPIPFPVLSLDQIWLVGDIHSVSTRHLAPRLSDHQVVVTKLAW